MTSTLLSLSTAHSLTLSPEAIKIAQCTVPVPMKRAKTVQMDNTDTALNMTFGASYNEDFTLGKPVRKQDSVFTNLNSILDAEDF